MSTGITDASIVVTIIVNAHSSSRASRECVRLMTELGPLDFLAISIKLREPFACKFPNYKGDSAQDRNASGN